MVALHDKRNQINWHYFIAKAWWTFTMPNTDISDRLTLKLNIILNAKAFVLQS